MRHVVIVAVPPVRILDVFGPAEVFGDANRQHGGDPAYQVTILSGGSDRVVASEIVSPVHADQTYREFRGPIDTLLVAGGTGASEMRFERGFLDWLEQAPGRSWLDVGCGTGALTATILAQAEPRAVTGIDPSAGYIDFAKAHVQDTRVQFKVAGAHAIPIESASFGVVVCGLALSFVPDHRMATAEMRRVARSKRSRLCGAKTDWVREAGIGGVSAGG